MIVTVAIHWHPRLLIGHWRILTQLVVGLRLEMEIHHRKMTIHRNQLRIQSHMRLKIKLEILAADWLMKSTRVQHYITILNLQKRLKDLHLGLKALLEPQNITAFFDKKLS